MPLLHRINLNIKDIGSLKKKLASFLLAGIAFILGGISLLTLVNLVVDWPPRIDIGPRRDSRLLLLLLTGILVVLLWKLPRWQAGRSEGLSDENRFDRENEARKTLAQILGGVFLLIGLYSSVQTLDLAREGQITDRFTKAVEELGALDDKGRAKIAIRLGGIYALERISLDSVKDAPAVMAVLAAYVRENSPRKEDGQINQEATSPGKTLATPQADLAADIQAILGVLGRRDIAVDILNRSEPLNLRNTYLRGAHLDWVRLGNVDLSGADLSGAKICLLADLTEVDLSGADLSRARICVTADLSGADLNGAKLNGANLNGAKLSGAKLTAADLTAADLTTADFTAADLTSANLRGAKLRRTRLSHANLSRADLSGADLSEALVLSQRQVDSARGDARTLLPENLKAPNSWGH